MIFFILKMDDESVRVSVHMAGDREVRLVTLTHKLTHLLMKKVRYLLAEGNSSIPFLQ